MKLDEMVRWLFAMEEGVRPRRCRCLCAGVLSVDELCSRPGFVRTGQRSFGEILLQGGSTELDMALIYLDGPCVGTLTTSGQNKLLLFLYNKA